MGRVIAVLGVSIALLLVNLAAFTPEPIAVGSPLSADEAAQVCGACYSADSYSPTCGIVCYGFGGGSPNLKVNPVDDDNGNKLSYWTCLCGSTPYALISLTKCDGHP